MTPTYRLLLLLAEVSGQWTPRDAGILKRLQVRYSYEDIADALRGVQAIVSGKLQAPEGALKWVLAWDARLLMVRDLTSGRRVLDLARDVWRRGHDLQARERGVMANREARAEMDGSSLERPSRAPVRLTI